MSIIEEQPPSDTSYPLAEWLTRLFRQARAEDFSIAERLSTSVRAGYGGARQDVDIAFDVPASPSYITMVIDTLRPVNQLGFSVDLVNETFSYTEAGVWSTTISFNIEGISELNQSRTFRARIYNVTDAVEVAFAVVPVSRNQGDIWFSVTLISDIIAADVNKVLRIELGGGDAISNGTLVGASIAANRVNELGVLV